MNLSTRLKIAWAKTTIINKLSFFLTVVIAGANIAYVIYAGKQFHTMSGQLKQMTIATKTSEQSEYVACRTLEQVQAGETDTHDLAIGTLAQAAAVTRAEAAQLTVTMVGSTIKSLDGDLSAPFLVSNIGNSNALNATVKSAIEVVDAKEEPQFTYAPSTLNIMTVGSVNRGERTQVIFYKTEHGKHSKLTRTTMAQIGTGTKYVVIYGQANYQDIFGLPHWAKFCYKVQFPNQNSNSGTHRLDAKCADYNAIDLAPPVRLSLTQPVATSLSQEFDCPEPKDNN